MSRQGGFSSGGLLLWAFAAAVCIACVSASPVGTDAEQWPSSVVFGLDLGPLQHARRHVVRTVRSDRFHKALGVHDVTEESSLLHFERREANPAEGSSKAQVGAQVGGFGWHVALTNESLKQVSKGPTSISFVSALRGVRLAFWLRPDGSVGPIEDIELQQKDQVGTSQQTKLPAFAHALRAMTWPPWFFLLPGRALPTGRWVELGSVTYPLGCAVPVPSLRQVSVRVDGPVPCVSGDQPGASDLLTAQSCAEVRMTLDASPDEIKKNFGTLIRDEQDRLETMSETSFGNLVCRDTIRARVRPATLELLSYDSERRVQADVLLQPAHDLLGTALAADQARMQIVDELVSESARLSWGAP